MKIAFISDLHLEFRQLHTQYILQGNMAAFFNLGFPEKLDADIIIIAGDTTHSAIIRDCVRKCLESYYGIPVFMCTGNHDHYHENFPNDDGQIVDAQGLRIALTTLWTRIPDTSVVNEDFPDFRFIKNASRSSWNELHAKQLAFLESANADLIVTHHLPSLSSIDPRFRGKSRNEFFATDLDLSGFSCKAWIHGHTHTQFDYVQDGIRIVCNPLGYPHERLSTNIALIEI